MKFAIMGLLSGVISGMGLGGGTLLIPLLTIWGGLMQREAQGVNLIVYLPAVLLALWSHHKEARIDFGVLKQTVVYGLLGAAMGTTLSHFTNEQMLRKGFAVLLIIVAVAQEVQAERQHRQRRKQG